MKCEHCGKDIIPGEKYCKSCCNSVIYSENVVIDDRKYYLNLSNNPKHRIISIVSRIFLIFMLVVSFICSFMIKPIYMGGVLAVLILPLLGYFLVEFVFDIFTNYFTLKNGNIHMNLGFKNKVIPISSIKNIKIEQNHSYLKGAVSHKTDLELFAFVSQDTNEVLFYSGISKEIEGLFKKLGFDVPKVN